MPFNLFTILPVQINVFEFLISLSFDNRLLIASFCINTKQRKSESHLFKWEDEAILDEIKMVDAKISDIVHDFQSLSKSVIEQLDSHKNWMMSLESDLMSKLNEHFEKQNQAVDEANRQVKEDR